MKQIKLFFFFILPSIFLISCSGNNNGADAAKNNNDTNTPAATTAGEDAHYSCTIDGQAVSGGAIDQFGFDNTGSIVPNDEKELLFYLRNIKSGQPPNDYTYSLRFAVPYKTGNMSYGHDEDGWGIEADIKKADGHEATYFTDSFNINITTLSSTRTEGTFSGKFKLQENATAPPYKKEIEVTDGKFDIPMASK